MIWHQAENEIKRIIDKLNKFHPTVKLISDYSREGVHILNVQVILEYNEISPDLYAKEMDSHKYLHLSSYHQCYCVKSIPWSQILRLNRICLSNTVYDNRYNQLEKWLSDRNYKQKLVRGQILKAGAVSRVTLLNSESNFRVEDRLVLNLTYHTLQSFKRGARKTRNTKLLLGRSLPWLLV